MFNKFKYTINHTQCDINDGFIIQIGFENDTIDFVRDVWLKWDWDNNTYQLVECLNISNWDYNGTELTFKPLPKEIEMKFDELLKFYHLKWFGYEEINNFCSDKWFEVYCHFWDDCFTNGNDD